MDSLTQIVLGSSVGELVLEKKLATKPYWGAIAGTIPDLDVVLNFLTDDISATEMHRAFLILLWLQYYTNSRVHCQKNQ